MAWFDGTHLYEHADPRQGEHPDWGTLIFNYGRHEIENFLIAKLWAPEYGSSADAALFEVLRAYSPYHNVRDGVAYPATLLAAAESDSRVHPSHARKMAAALQHATSGSEPILLRLESKAGHGAGKPTAKLVDEQADVYSFLMWKLGLVRGSEVGGGRAADSADER